MRLDGKIALITGGTSGIGRATARLFCKEGAKVAIVGRTPAKGEETVKLIEKEGGNVFYVRGDMSKPADAENVVRETVKHYGTIDVLFNNIGIHISKRSPIEDIDPDDWDNVLAVNLKGIFLGTKYTVPIMKKQGKGVIVNTSSVYGFVGTAGDIAYCASKGGVLQFTKAAALELAQYGIRVNAVCPGFSIGVTPEGYVGYGRLRKFGSEEAKRLEARIGQFPIGRFGRYEDIANAVLFLACDESSFVTGMGLLVDGGYAAR